LACGLVLFFGGAAGENFSRAIVGDLPDQLAGFVSECLSTGNEPVAFRFKAGDLRALGGGVIVIALDDGPDIPGNAVTYLCHLWGHPRFPGRYRR
jgi:hypothetical protein